MNKIKRNVNSKSGNFEHLGIPGLFNNLEIPEHAVSFASTEEISTGNFWSSGKLHLMVV